MEQNEYKLNILNLYKEGKLTDYSFQQELSKFVGSMSEVHLSETVGKNTASSYAIFMYPEKHVNGIKIIYLINKDIFTNNFYSSEELIERLDGLVTYRQMFIKEFMKFLNKTKKSAVTLGKALAMYLRLYNATIGILSIKDKDFLPDDLKLSELIIKLDDGVDVNNIIERLTIENILPTEVLNAAKKLVHDIPEDNDNLKIKFITDGSEIPTVNLGQQEIRDLCTGTFGVRDHKDIDPDYVPSTNQ